VNAAVPCVHFAFLPHLCDLQGVQGVSDVTTQIFAPPHGFLRPTDVVIDQRLQEIVDRRVLKTAALAKLRFALVDLTDLEPNSGKSKTEVRNIHGTLVQPEVAGVAGKGLIKQGGVGSIGKLACMWAAYQLKFDVESLARQAQLKDKDRLFDQGGACRQKWDILQRPSSAPATVLHPTHPQIECRGKLIWMDGQGSGPSSKNMKPICLPSGADYPDLYRIFDVTSPGGGPAVLNFIGSPPGSHGIPASASAKKYYKKYKDTDTAEGMKAARALDFWDRLLLMIAASDNVCAQTCIENVGYLYIDSLLWQSGFFSPSRNGGLWLGSGYSSRMPHRWMMAPVPKGDPGNDFITGTAASVAALFTALAQNRLVHKGACDGMRFLTDVLAPDGFYGSWFANKLNGSDRDLDKCNAKVGIGLYQGKKAYDDSAFIERTVHDERTKRKTKIRYVATAFDTLHASLLEHLIIKLDDCILEYNGLKNSFDP
jgi:hypothetical protein